MRVILMMVLALIAGPTAAQDKAFDLAVPEALADTGFMRHLLPRFSLKHGIRITQVSPGAPSQASLGETGTPVFEGAGAVWRLEHDGTPATNTFAEWLRSEVGRNTIAAFKIDGAQAFSANIEVEVAEVEIAFDGDPVRGKDLSFTHCGRCHTIDRTNRMNSLGSTPSFGMLRTLPDWQNRFTIFYVLNPHPSFTQIEDITPPFDPLRPPPIFPVQMTQDDLEHMMAFVATIPLADLGAPVQSQ